MKKHLLFGVVCLLLSLTASITAQTSTLYFTNTGGSFAGEKWISITTGADNTGTVIWSQGNGTIGDAPGLLTDQAFTVTDGVDFYVNCYDQFDDGWDGTTYEVRDAAGGGILVINNGGVTPSDGTDTDATANWDATEEERETSEVGNYTPPACTPGAGSAVIGSCDPANGIMLDVTVSDLGDGSIVITNDGGAADMTVTTLTTVSIGPFAFSSNVTVTLEHPTDAICNVTLAALTLPSGCPPANDECAGATEITVGTGTCDGATTNGDNTTASDEGFAAASCFSGDNPDVWHFFTAPASGMVDISTDFEGGSNTDTEIALYSGACGALVEEECDQDGGTAVNFNSTIAGAVVIPGDVYYVRVSGWNGSAGTFCLQIEELCSISLVAGNPTMCDPATNTYDVDITVTHNAAPATGMLDVNGTLVAIGTSPQVVTLTATADGVAVDVTASFTDDTGCTVTELAAYTSPVGCSLTCEITAMTIGTTGACTHDGTSSTFTQEVTVTYSTPPATGTLDVTVGTTTLNEAITTSPQVVTVTGIPADGMTLDVTAVFSADAACTFELLASVTAPADCTPLVNDICDDATEITVGAGTCDGATTNGTNAGAIDEAFAAAGCFSGDNPDVWYFFTAPASGMVSVSTDFTGGSNTDTEIALYSGACGALVEDACDQDSGSTVNFNSTIASAAVIPGDTYYVRVSGWNGTEGDFCLEILELCNISIVVGAPSACIPQTNTYIVEVVATYGAAPATGTLDVNGESFPITSSPQTLMVELPADGALTTITANFSDDVACTATEADAYTAPADCAVNCSINTITVGTTGVCTYDGTAATFTQTITVDYSVPPAVGTLDVTVGSITVTAPITTSPQIVMVPGIPADGSTLDVTVAFSMDAMCTDTEVGAVTAPSNSCTPPDCAASPVLACGETINTGDLSGSGAWNPDGVDGFAGCFNTPGKEFVFQFVAADAGDYTLDIVLTGGTSSWNDYFFRTDEVCDESGWTCLDDISTAATLTIPGVAAGATVYVLVDSETAGAGRIHDVTLGCPPPPIANEGGVGFCQNAAPAMVDGTGGKINLLVGGNIIAAVSSTEDLGMVEASYVRFDASDNATRDYAATGGGDGVDLIDRSLVITPEIQPTGPVTVFLYFTDAEYDEIIANNDGDNASASWADLGITKFDTDVCADLVNPNMLGGTIVPIVASVVVTGGWEVEISVSSFSGFQVHEGQTALPIKLNRFTAKEAGRHNMVEWSTSSEINVQDHTLMKSIDATNWEAIGVVDGEINSSSNLEYEMVDYNPFNITYYQLMTTDIDGSTSYSPVVSVTRDSEEASAFLGASPVPTVDVVNLNVYSQLDDNITITLTDISGKRVILEHKTLTQGNHQLPLDMSNLTNGVYLVTITSDYIRQTHRVIKN